MPQQIPKPSGRAGYRCGLPVLAVTHDLTTGCSAIELLRSSGTDGAVFADTSERIQQSRRWCESSLICSGASPSTCGANSDLCEAHAIASAIHSFGYTATKEPRSVQQSFTAAHAKRCEVTTESIEANAAVSEPTPFTLNHNGPVV